MSPTIIVNARANSFSELVCKMQ